MRPQIRDDQIQPDRQRGYCVLHPIVVYDKVLNDTFHRDAGSDGMLDSRLEIQSLKIRDVVEDYRGRLVVPEFQREYVWKPSRAPKLIDSIYRGFPISVLLLWTSDVETRSRRKDPKPTRSGLISWLIDGQQRVITLSRILSGDEGIDVVFNPYEDAFRLANAATNRDNSWIRVSEILDDESYRQIRRTLPDGSKGEKLRLSLSVSGRF